MGCTFEMARGGVMCQRSFLKHNALSSRSACFTCGLILLFCIAMGAGITAFENDAQAQAYGMELNDPEMPQAHHGRDYGWELDVGLGFGSWCVVYNPGIALTLSGGYRFTDWFSLNLEQSYMRLAYEGDDDHRYHFGLDIMETVLTTKFIWINDAQNFELYLKLGAGFVVIGWLDVFWSLPTGIGMNYYFTDTLGIGLDVQYHWTFEYGTFKTVLHLAVRF